MTYKTNKKMKKRIDKFAQDAYNSKYKFVLVIELKKRMTRKDKYRVGRGETGA